MWVMYAEEGGNWDDVSFPCNLLVCDKRQWQIGLFPIIQFAIIICVIFNILLLAANMFVRLPSLRRLVSHPQYGRVGHLFKYILKS